MVSVIVTTYNRSEYLLKCLHSLVNQSISPSNYEVIVVDNNCTDNTSVLTQQFIEEHPDTSISYFLEKEQGLTFARNRGIRESRGDIIAYIDDDAMAHSDYCKSLYEASKQYPDYHAFGGKIFPVFPDGKEPAWLSKHVWGMVAKIDHGDQVSPFKKKFPAGCNMAFRKNVLLDLDGFNTDVKFRSDDRDIFTRLRHRGYKVLYVPDASVDHFIPPERISRGGVRKISILTGIGERNRLSGNPLGYLQKLLGYLLKIEVAILLSLFYRLKGESEKKMIVNIMYWTLLGFLGRASVLDR